MTLKEPPQVLNGQIQHVLTSDKNGGVEYSNIPVYGRKMLNEFEMGKSGGDKEVGESKGEQGKESKNVKLNNVQDNGDKKSKKLKNKKIRNEKFITDLSLKNRFVALEGLKEGGEKKENKKFNKAIEKTKIENNEEEEEEDENCNQNCEEVVCEDEDEIGGFLAF